MSFQFPPPPFNGKGFKRWRNAFDDCLVGHGCHELLHGYPDNMPAVAWEVFNCRFRRLLRQALSTAVQISVRNCLDKDYPDVMAGLKNKFISVNADQKLDLLERLVLCKRSKFGSTTDFLEEYNAILGEICEDLYALADPHA